MSTKAQINSLPWSCTAESSQPSATQPSPKHADTIHLLDMVSLDTNRRCFEALKKHKNLTPGRNRIGTVQCRNTGLTPGRIHQDALACVINSHYTWRSFMTILKLCQPPRTFRGILEHSIWAKTRTAAGSHAASYQALRGLLVSFFQGTRSTYGYTSLAMEGPNSNTLSQLLFCCLRQS